jgi:hypothetical protein
MRRARWSAAGALIVLARAAPVVIAACGYVANPAPRDTTAVPPAIDDAYTVSASPFTQAADAGVLANDRGSPLTVVAYSDPQHGTLTLNPDGSFTYTPAPGYVGRDQFTYRITDAVELRPMVTPALGTIGGFVIQGDGFGSALSAIPGRADAVYGLTDRGPNAFLPDGTVIEPLPDFQPSIGEFTLGRGSAQLRRSIGLRDAAGRPYSGRLNADNHAGDRMLDPAGNELPPDPNGYDPEGLVALPDGTFWVSDEYGPFVTHFDATGRALRRLSPLDGSLPRELARRVSNRGMEGLAITPDGSTLVGIMQSALRQPDLDGVDPLNVTIVRIVTYRLATGELREYLYLLDDPAINATAVSEIAALTNTTFLVDERNRAFPPGAYKKLWRIDLTAATDVGPQSTVPGASYDAAPGGLLINGQTLERLLAGQDTRTAAATLARYGIKPVQKEPFLDVGALSDELDPSGRFFAHDKLEGIVVSADGTHVLLSNDSDFGIDVTGSAPPYRLRDKVSPATGGRDAGEILTVDMTRLPPRQSSATVTLDVTPPKLHHQDTKTPSLSKAPLGVLVVKRLALATLGPIRGSSAPRG